MTYILKNATVITMDDQRVFYNTDLFVANGRILKIAPHIEPLGVNTVDCTGKFLLPGLIDCHVHMDSNEITEMLLANGVTACRNMWGFPETQQWCREIEQGKRFGPKVYSTGPLTDGQTYCEHSLIVTTPEQAEQAVVDCLNGGYQYVKTYPSIPRDAFKRIMEAANNFGIKVMGHGNYNVSFRELRDWGYYSLEHTSCLPKTDDEVLMLAESDMWFCPTLTVGRTIYNYVHLDHNVRETKHYDSMCGYWHRDWDKITAWRKSLHRYDNMDFEGELERARLFVRHSDNILMGTDVPNPGVTGGFSAHEELADMARTFGMSPYQALRTATVNAARSLGISGSKGMLKPGMDADILILEKNPLEDIANTETFCAVIREGTYHDKAECEAVLARVRQYRDDEIEALM